MGWVGDVLGSVGDAVGDVAQTVVDNPLIAAGVVGGLALGVPALAGAAGDVAGAAAAGDVAAGAGLAGAADAGLGSLGSGMFGAIGSSAADFGLGAGLGDVTLGSIGAAGLGDAAAAGGLAGISGMSAADWIASQLPTVGETVAGGASGLLGSGFYGTGISDIGSLLGTTGGDFALGSGLSGLDIGSTIGQFGDSLVDHALGSVLSDAAPNAPDFANGIQLDGNQFANEANKLVAQDAMEPGAYWDAINKTPTITLGGPSTPKPVQSIGKSLINNGINSLLNGPPQQQRPGQSGPLFPNPTPNNFPVANTNNGIPQNVFDQGEIFGPIGHDSLSIPQPVGSQNQGALSAMGQNASLLETPNDKVSRQLQRVLADQQSRGSQGPQIFSQQNFSGDKLQGGKNDATLAGYELWKALNS